MALNFRFFKQIKIIILRRNMLWKSLLLVVTVKRVTGNQKVEYLSDSL